MSRLATALVLGAMLLPGFSQSTGDAPAFEAASIKLHETDDHGQSTQTGGPGTADPGRITATYRPLRTLLLGAYGIKTYQLELPETLNSARYDIAATVPAGATKEQARAMMVDLLTTRLNLKIRRETRTMQVYALVPAKSGSKLQPSAGDPTWPAAGQTDSDGFTVPKIDFAKGGMGDALSGLNMKLYAVKQTIAQLIGRLDGEVDAPIVDLTGLTGKFDFTLHYAAKWRRAGSSGQSEGDVIEGNGQSITDAIVKDLGLKLEPRKMPVEMVIVTSGQKTPAGN